MSKIGDISLTFAQMLSVPDRGVTVWVVVNTNHFLLRHHCPVFYLQSSSQLKLSSTAIDCATCYSSGRHGS